MSIICNRLNKRVTRVTDLSQAELYVAWHLPDKPVYTFKPDMGPQKKTSDIFEHSKKSVINQTYAEYFREKLVDVPIHPDAPMATMKGLSRSRTNYMQASPIDAKTKTTASTSVEPNSLFYYPIELLHYAPLDQADSKLFSKLPSILVRLTQLHQIEKLRERLKMEQYTVREASLLDLTFDSFLAHGSRGHA
jgi:hypothetical protein